MNLYPLMIVAVVLLAREGMRDSMIEAFGTSTMHPWGIIGLSVLPYIAILSLTSLVLTRCTSRARRGRGPTAIAKAHKAMSLTRIALLFQHAMAVWGLGFLDSVRTMTGDMLLIDELIVIAFPVLGVAVLWSLYFPLERLQHEAMTLRRIDMGKAISPMPRLGTFVFSKLRMQMFPMLIPLLAILVVGELIEITEPERLLPLSMRGAGPEVIRLAAVLVIFILSPLVLRYVMVVVPLGAGPTRDALLDVCRAHGVKVRDILVWQTNSSMINAAVTGLISPLRYVMLSDALLETMSREQLIAVMAHEIGHVRRRHMPWMLISLMALIIVCSALIWGCLWLLDRAGVTVDWQSPEMFWFTTGGAIVLVLLAIGWVSRRFERQADTFAVEHLSAHPADTEPRLTLDLERGVVQVEVEQPSKTITGRAIESMNSALGCIAHRHMIRRDRRDWRHGSIGARQQYLKSLSGASLHRPMVHRVVFGIKAASALVVVGFLAWTFFDRGPDRPVLDPDPADIVRAELFTDDVA